MEGLGVCGEDLGLDPLWRRTETNTYDVEQRALGRLDRRLLPSLLSSLLSL